MSDFDNCSSCKWFARPTDGYYIGIGMCTHPDANDCSNEAGSMLRCPKKLYSNVSLDNFE